MGLGEPGRGLTDRQTGGWAGDNVTGLTNRGNRVTQQEKDYPIKVGTFLFTMVEPHAGHEVPYNRWYEHDHFYSGCLVGPNVFAGDRFVATRRLKDLRSTATNDMTPDPLTGSYLAVYWWLEGTDDETNRWNVDNVVELHKQGRMYAERDHVHTLLYAMQWNVQKDPTGCTIDLALDHGYKGLVVVAGDVAEGHTHAEVDAWFQDTWIPDAMTKPWGPELVGSGTVIPLSDDAPADVVRAAAGPNRFLQLHFLDHDSAEGWEEGYARLGEQIEASGLAHHVWTAPWQQTNFGTDDFTDQLR